MKKTALIMAMVILAHCNLLFAQDNTAPSKEELIYSMGQPPRYEFYASPMAMYDGEEKKWGGQLTGGLYRHLLNPNYGIGLSAEAYAGTVDNRTDSGIRALAGLKLIFLQAGLDHSFRKDETDAIFSLAFPLRRGGLFGRGDYFRIDWLPGRDNTVNIGLTFPLGQPYKGRTRPKKDHVVLPAMPGKPRQAPALSPDLEQALARARHAADWINRFTTPFIDQDISGGEDELEDFRDRLQAFKEHMDLRDPQYPLGHTCVAEVRAYHQAVEQAFALALHPDRTAAMSPAADGSGARIAAGARRILLHEVIIPYNQLLGQNKDNDTLLGYGVRARHEFGQWLDREMPLDPSQRQVILHVFDEFLQIMENSRARSKGVWQDAKLVWIPLQYALMPSEYNTQEKMDRILEQVTGDTFKGGNDVHYVINEQFQAEVARMVLDAQDYHVLWIHDYRGMTPAGNPDRIGFAMTLLGYLGAIEKRVEAYDETGSFPLYLIFIDQFYYEANNGRLWMDLLENPLGHELRLPDGYGDWERQIREAQEKLRAAVQNSTRLQAQAARLGRHWLENRIKVHVNVTNPADWSFRSARLIDNFPIAPDVLMRDHRKISFYDITEKDPGKGEAIFAGLGIGEHYAGPTWNDRSILVRGPALVTLKDAARRLLLRQGFREDQIPAPLRKFELPPDYGAMVRAMEQKGWNATVMDLYNKTGFQAKSINTLKAALYSLMPPGSTIIVPDSLWNSPFWGGMLASAALRGCRVLIIAPSLQHAPSSGFPQMSRAHELFARMLMIQQVLEPEIDAAGGMLKVGIYSPESDVGDIRGMMREFRESVRRYPFLRKVFPFGPEAYKAIATFDAELEAEGFQPTYYTQDVEERKPKLHLKTNFFASKEMRDLMAWDGWGEVILQYGRYRAAIVGRKEVYVDVRDIPEALEDASNALLNSYWSALSDDEKGRVMYYLVVGSQNQDYRGMIMDGEAVAAVSGPYSLQGVIDLVFIASLCTWVDDQQELETLLPPEKGWRRWLGRYIMKAL